MDFSRLSYYALCVFMVSAPSVVYIFFCSFPLFCCGVLCTRHCSAWCMLVHVGWSICTMTQTCMCRQ